MSGNPFNAYAQPRLPAGRRTPHDNRRRERRADDLGYQVVEPASNLDGFFKLDQFAAPDNLYKAFQQLVEGGGHGAGVDGFRPEHFSEAEIRPALRRVSTALIFGSYRPYPVRIVEIPKSETKVRTLALQRFTDRTVAKALLNCLTAFWQRRHVIRSVWQIYAQLDREIRRRQTFFLAIDDIKDCFPNAPLDTIMHWHRRHICDEQLLRLIERIIRGHDGLNHLTGLYQGSPYSPIAMEVLLHHVLDVMLEAHSRNTPILRYVDNLTFLCRDVSEGIRVLGIAREVAGEAGFQLKGEDGEPQDLRDPHYDRVVLGLIPRWQNGLLTFAIPDSAFENLRQGLRIAHEAERPADNAKKRCFGWLQMLGPALTRSVEREVVDQVLDIARQAGFRNVIDQDLLCVTSAARRSWHRVLQDVR
jgi:RNA-directed DNA polymerase